jgi:hypothetical protein
MGWEVLKSDADASQTAATPLSFGDHKFALDSTLRALYADNKLHLIR